MNKYKNTYGNKISGFWVFLSVLLIVVFSFYFGMLYGKSLEKSDQPSAEVQCTQVFEDDYIVILQCPKKQVKMNRSRTPTITPSRTPTASRTLTATGTPVVISPMATANCVPALDVWVCDKKP